MYSLNFVQIQNLENLLRQYHQLFSGSRCVAQQLEELIIKAIKTDMTSVDSLQWKGFGHSIDCDLVLNQTEKIQIKAGDAKPDKLILSGHRLGRFKEDLDEINSFLLLNLCNVIAVPYHLNVSELGNEHWYRIYYIDAEYLKPTIENSWEETEGSRGGYYFEQYNEHGTRLRIVPSMSHQVWWELPKSLFNQANLSRILKA